MLKVLFKKQFYEMMLGGGRAENKKGKIKKKSLKVNVIVWGVALFIVAIAIFALALGMCGGLVDAGYDALYFSIMAVMSIFLGTFGSVFNTYNALYLSKDNEMLLSMPIKPGHILLSRALNVVLLAFIYSQCIWFPAILAYWIFAKVSVLTVIYPILLILVLTMLVSILTCGIGFIVAFLSTKLKNNKIINIVLTLSLIAGLYALQFNMTNIMNAVVENASAVDEVMKSWLLPIYYIGVAASGNSASMFIYLIVVIALTILTYYILSSTFVKIATTKISVKKNVYKNEKMQKSSSFVALVKKEFKKFYSTTLYFLNAGLGSFIMLILAIVALFKMNSLDVLINEMSLDIPFIKSLVVVLIPGVLSMMLGMNGITAPTISLEAKTIWLLKSLPINTKDILNAKVAVAVIYNGISAILGAILLQIAFKVNIMYSLFMIVPTLVFVIIMAEVGILANLKIPNLEWTNEVVPIKQGAPIAIAMFGGMFMSVIIYVPYIFMADKLNPIIYLGVLSIILVGVEELLRYALNTKGIEMFEKL